jgi:hypothetical protein
MIDSPFSVWAAQTTIKFWGCKFDTQGRKPSKVIVSLVNDDLILSGSVPRINPVAPEHSACSSSGKMRSCNQRLELTAKHSIMVRWHQKI